MLLYLIPKLCLIIYLYVRRICVCDKSECNFVLQESLNMEMDQDLNTTLSTDDQQELADLAEEIKNLTKESKQALRERSQV